MRWSSVADRNVFIVSFGFFFVFSGYQATQRFATSVDPHHGSISLGILYIVFLITNFTAAPIFKAFPAKITLVLSTFAYIFFIASNIGYNLVLLYFSAILVGLSAPILWISKERLIADSSNYYESSTNLPLYSQIGYYNGIFWIIFLFHQVLGSLFGALILQFGFSIDVMYGAFTTLALIGTIVLIFVKNIKHTDSDDKYRESVEIEMTEEEQSKALKNEKQKPILIASDHESIHLMGTESKCYWIANEIRLSVYSTVGLWKEWDFQCILIFTVYTGLLEGYIAADYPLLIKDDALKLYMLAYYGFISAIFALIFGKLADIISYVPIVGMVFVVHLFYWIFLYLYIDRILEKQSLVMLVGISTVLALGYAGCTQIYAIYPILLGKESYVWQNTHVFRTLPISIVFLMHNFVTIESKIIAYAIIMVLGCIPVLCFPSIGTKLKSVLQKESVRQIGHNLYL